MVSQSPICSLSLNYPHGKAFLGVCAAAGQAELRAGKDAIEGGGHYRFELRERLVIVRRVEAVIREDDEFIGFESNLLFQKFARLNSRFDDRRQVIRRTSGRRSFAIVEKARPAFGAVQAEVAFVRDQENSGALMHVAVVVDVDQKVARNSLPLDPAVKDPDEVVQLDG